MTDRVFVGGVAIVAFIVGTGLVINATEQSHQITEQSHQITTLHGEIATLQKQIGNDREKIQLLAGRNTSRHTDTLLQELQAVCGDLQVRVGKLEKTK